MGSSVLAGQRAFRLTVVFASALFAISLNVNAEVVSRTHASPPAGFETDTTQPHATAISLIQRTEVLSLKPPLLHLEITSAFGMRLNPILRTRGFHRGVDYGAPVGTPVYAAQAGRIEALGMQDHAGLYVRMRHSQSMETVYAHLHRFMPGLRVGSVLRCGDIIGFVGSSGFATGPHLHYEVLVAGTPIDPETSRMIGLIKTSAKN